jgi:GR25 family glycosyltransferase involved in LPS biosynthesis
MFHKHFDKTFLINLDRRPDRLAASKRRADLIGLEFERFPACDGAKENLHIISAQEIGQSPMYWNLAAAGLCVTLTRIIERAKSEKLDSILILEDDFSVNPDIKDVNKFIDDNIKDVPSDWETLYLGANHLRPFVPMTEHVAKLSGAYACHAHAVRSTIFDIMLEELSKINNPIDVTYCEVIHPRGKSYVFRPHPILQAEDYSDIVKNRVNYTFLRK